MNKKQLEKRSSEVLTCDICGRPDTARTPLLYPSNGGQYEPIKKVCSECVSCNDGMFAWDGDKVVFI